MILNDRKSFVRNIIYTTGSVIGIKNNFEEIVNCIVKGNKKKLASLCIYPIKRDYPLPDIENAKQMIAYFDTLFDRSYRRT